MDFNVHPPPLQYLQYYISKQPNNNNKIIRNNEHCLSRANQIGWMIVLLLIVRWHLIRFGVHNIEINEHDGTWYGNLQPQTKMLLLYYICCSGLYSLKTIEACHQINSYSCVKNNNKQKWSTLNYSIANNWIILNLTIMFSSLECYNIVNYLVCTCLLVYLKFNSSIKYGIEKSLTSISLDYNLA